MIVQQTARVRRWSFVLGSSIAAMAAASATPAWAQCSPDPAVAYGTTTCDGIDPDGLIVSTPYTQINVAPGAIVQSGSAEGAITFSGLNDYLTVNGSIDGGSAAGIAVVAGPANSAPTGYPAASANLSVAADGAVSGTQALLITRSPSNSTGYLGVSLSNAGIMTGTSGPAIVNNAGSDSTLSVSNLATGSIFGISGVNYLTNLGLIDGAGSTAVVVGPDGAFSGANITNYGRIVSSGTAPTVSAPGSLTVYNASGAELGGSSTAISVAGALNLTNSGIINGSVISTAAAGKNSVVDTRQGTINGDLILGAGNDSVSVAYENGSVGSVSGAINGGAGTDTIVFGIGHDETIGNITLPTNFEVLGFDLASNATLTLDSAFSQTNGVAFSGYGTVVNQADLSTQGAAFVANSFVGTLSLANEGNITAANQSAVAGFTTIANSGSITAVGGMGVSGARNLTNSGSITASGTGVLLDYGTFVNSGLIQSTGGAGANLQSVQSYAGTINAGTIIGATTGLVLSNGSLINTGTIVGGQSGVTLNYSGTFINSVGGVVSGGSYGVVNTGWSARVANAGQINGDVNFAPISEFDSSDDVFVDAGGVVNGAIVLGGGDDQLVVDLNADPARPFAGATGGVDAGAGYDTLRYTVGSDAHSDLALVNGFEALAYELDNYASLTLTAQNPIDSVIGLIGNGTVTLDGSISSTNHAVIDTSIPTVGQLVYGVAGVAQDLTIVNNGSLSLNKNDPYTYSLVSVVNAGNANVTNNGEISAASAAGSYYPAYGIFGGSAVNNAGSITLTGGGVGIGGASNVVNSGTITDTDESRAKGIVSFNTLVNSGTISVDGNAVEAGYYTTQISNSGTIESRNATGVTLAGYGSVLYNEESGVIKGAVAVNIDSGGLIVNRGIISGDISSYAYSSGSTTYISDGGTLDGNLTFGAGYDTFIMTGAATGVTGAIDGGGGDDMFGYGLTNSTNVSLDIGKQLVGFENAMVQIVGTDAVATVSATDQFSGSLYVSGTGKVLNTATIQGDVSTQTRYLGGVIPLTDLSMLSSFENQGQIEGAFSGNVGTFINGGLISGRDGVAVALYGQDGLTFVNSGHIGSGVVLSEEGKIALTNSGTIENFSGYYTGQAIGLSLYGNGNNSGVTNTSTGVITGEGSGGYGVYAYNTGLTLDNAGLIRGGAGSSYLEGAAVYLGGMYAATIRNSGTIDGAVQLGQGDDFFVNSGTVTGPVTMGGGNDLVENSGTMGSIDLGAGDDHLRLSGGTFAGAVYGGEGSDSIEIGGGQAAFSTISDVEALRMSAGLATVSGSAAFDSMTLTGGRVIGLAGSTITAPTITVGQGATFGSAGTVNGDIAVAGTLSPGASPGTMTVNGNVTLASTSVSVFEITPTVSDKLIVNGNLTIASGATLQIDATGIVPPGQSLDLIDADSITGSFTNIVRSGSLFGVLVQDGNTVSLLGEFMNDTAFTPQVQGSIDYVNGLLASGQASTAFLAAVPELAASSSTANQTVFAQLTPEAYASAGQIAVEHGLELADVGRSDAFAPRRETPGGFTFASALGNTRTLEGGPQGAARARINGYGFLGGIGWGSSDWSIGGFVGYLNSRQTLSSLGARTEVDGVIAGVHGRWSNGKLGIKATVAYDGGKADTRRDLLGASAKGSYDLTGWTGDLSLTYAMPLSHGWTVQPTLGVTAIRTTRDQTAEAGDSPYVLEVARERDHAVFVDGGLTFKGGMQDGAALRPYLTVGMRYQVEGRAPFALAALGGGDFGLAATGAQRAPVLATATMGADVAVNSSLTLFGSLSGEAGNADRRAGGRVGLRLAF